MVPWHEDDTFWEDIAPFLFTDIRCGEGARREVEQVIALSNVSPGAKILDIGCGPGRHAMEFARRGFSVTGVDRTAAFLERAVRQADEEQLPVEFVLADMRSFHRPVCFDAAISLYSTFGYFESEEDESAVLRNLFASLKPGGRLVMELLGKELIARDFRARDWQCSPDGTAFLLEEREVRGGWGLLAEPLALALEHQEGISVDDAALLRCGVGVTAAQYRLLFRQAVRRSSRQPVQQRGEAAHRCIPEVIDSGQDLKQEWPPREHSCGITDRATGLHSEVRGRASVEWRVMPGVLRR